VEVTDHTLSTSTELKHIVSASLIAKSYTSLCSRVRNNDEAQLKNKKVN